MGLGVARRVKVAFTYVKAVRCRNRSLEALEGLVIGETRNMLEILTPTGSRKLIPKEECWFYITYRGGRCVVLVNGQLLVRLFEERRRGRRRGRRLSRGPSRRATHP